jgi:hypothetical protein
VEHDLRLQRHPSRRSEESLLGFEKSRPARRRLFSEVLWRDPALLVMAETNGTGRYDLRSNAVWFARPPHLRVVGPNNEV